MYFNFKINSEYETEQIKYEKLNNAPCVCARVHLIND